MASKGSLSFIELHLEKALLGLAVLFLLGVGVRHLILEPNKVELGGEKLGPGELDEAIERQARELQTAVKNATPSTKTIPEYARKLRERFEGGLFASDDPNAPVLTKRLEVPARFGSPVPVLEEGTDEEDVVVVTPLKPTALAVRTGISLVQRTQTTIAAAGFETVGGPADEDEGPAELSWVTVGGYFAREAQQLEMLASNYAAYRAKPYVAGVDVQRQEMTADGTYTDWEDVTPGKAMPKVDIPPPVIDDKTGEVVNQAELEQKFEAIKQAQLQILQPPFYPVEAGDDWDTPPLAGLDTEDEEEELELAAKPEAETPAERERPREPARPSAPPSGRSNPRGAAAPPPSNPRGGGGRMAPPQAAPTGGDDEAAQPSAAKQAKEQLKNARKALREKSWVEAERLARSVIDRGEASKGEQAAARKIINDARRAQARADRKAQARSGSQVPQELLTNPEKEGEVALWFHDDSVTPGKTYRYRMRVKLWNRYVGRRSSLRDPTQARSALLVGDWSLPSPPVTVAPRQHFFVGGPAIGEPAARVEVYNWYKGNWLKEDFKVRAGDIIGGVVETRTGELDRDARPKKEKVDFSTGALVLDVRFDEPVLSRTLASKGGEFNYREAKSLVLVYLDPADGQVKERVSEVDRNEPLAKKLKEEWESFKETLR